MSERFETSQNNLAGYLLKRTTNGEWQKRYFEINGSYLTYYKSQKMSKLLAALSIPQVGAIKMLGQTDSEADFQIDIKDRQYVLRASSLAEAQTWVFTLTRVRDSGNGNSINPMNSREELRSNSTSSSSLRPTANVQKSVRSGCLSWLLRVLGLVGHHD